MEKFFKFLMSWNELLTIPLGLALWYYAPVIMRMSGFDETAGSYDGAVLMKIIFAIVAMAIISGFAWIFIKLAFPEVYKYLDNVLGDNLEEVYNDKNLSKWQRSVIVLWLLSLYVSVTAYLVSAI
jgi:hypothetical protein